MPDQHMLSDRDRRDIQGLVLFGTTCPHLRYHLLRVNEAVAGRRFVHRLIEHGSRLAVNTAGIRDEDTRSEKLIYVGFTWKGLEALAVPGPTLNSFPGEFRQGAKARAADLADTGDSAPDKWTFDPDAVHIAVMLYARRQQTLDDLSRDVVASAEANGCSVVTMLDAQAIDDYTHASGQHLTKPVHFGYSDGLSQPDILPADNRKPGAPPPVPPGMFVL